MNGGETTVQGIEFDATAIVVPDWLTVRATYSINDTQIKLGRATTGTEALEGILGYGSAGFTPTCRISTCFISVLAVRASRMLRWRVSRGAITRR